MEYLIMSDIEDVLREKTFKEEGMEIERRVFYTLTEEAKLTNHRNSKAIALLVKVLQEKEILSEPEIDSLLLECIN
mgnify:CR=1 FL=1